VNFLKSLNADVCELASSVERELTAYSGLRRMETWKSLRMMSDKVSVLETVGTRILSLVYGLSVLECDHEVLLTDF